MILSDSGGVQEKTNVFFTNSEAYNKMSKASNPYGDGHASERIADAIVKKYTR